MSKLVCSRCGRSIPPALKLCPSCGGKPTDKAASPSGKAAPSGTQRSELSATAAPQATPQKPQQRSRTQAGSQESTQSSASASTPNVDDSPATPERHATGVEADPEVVKLDSAIAANGKEIQKLRQKLRVLKQDMSSDLAILARTVDSTISIDDARAKKRRAELTREKAGQEKAGQQELATLHKDGVSRAVAQANKVKRDIAGLRSFRPSMATGDLKKGDLCPGLQVRPFATVGKAVVPRVAKLLGSRLDLPALVPFVDQGSIAIKGSLSDPSVRAMVKQLVAQAFTAAPPGQMVVSVFDPGFSTVFSGFQAEGAADSKLFTVIQPNQAALERALEDHTFHFTAVDRSCAGAYHSMSELVRETGQHEHQYRVLVLLDAPTNWSERIASDLKRLIAKGKHVGISVIVQFDDSVEAPYKVNIEDTLGSCTRIEKTGNFWSIKLENDKEKHVFQPVGDIDTDNQQQLMKTVVAEANIGVLPNVPFREVVSRDLYWMNSGDAAPRLSSAGMDVFLGKKGAQRVSFQLGNSDSNLHNVLVGGRAGTGKTVLLKMMIYSLAAQYSPEELRFFLLDFKEGVEFQQFAESETSDSPLPHAEVISIQSDPQFAIATLQYFKEELSRRSKLFKAADGVQNIEAYRRKTGEILPRWVFVADEFQVMLSGSTNEVATELIEFICRQGRSFGLHLILASQTLSGIRFGGGDKDKAIFENIPARVVLTLSPEESARFLQADNKEAAKLRYRGQAILNTQAGALEDNQQFVVAFADNDFYSHLQDELYDEWAHKDGHDVKVRVYNGNKYVTAAELIKSAQPQIGRYGEIPVWYGQQSTVKAEPAAAYFSNDTGSNLLILGNQDTRSAIATAQLAALSYLAAIGGDTEVIVFEALSRQDLESTDLEAWRKTMRALCKGKLTFFHKDQAADFVEELTALTNEESPALVVTLNAGNSEFKALAQGEGRFEKIIRNLPRNGGHWIGQWSDERDLPYYYSPGADVVNDFSTVLFVGASEKAVMSSAGCPKSDIPSLGRSRTIVYSTHMAQAGLLSVASVAPFTTDDFDAWKEA